MFSFARNVMDFIQSATGLKVKPENIYGLQTMDDILSDTSSDRSRKSHSPKVRVSHTSLSNALEMYRHSLITSQSLSSSLVSLELMEADFLYALSQYCAKITLRNGKEVLIRPILPNDIEEMKAILQRGEVSSHSLSMRFNSVTSTVKESMLKYFTNIDYDTHFAIAALIRESDSWKPIASARFIEDSEDPSIAEWAALVLDQYHGVGVGSSLLYYLSIMASHFNINSLRAIVHHENYPVLHWMKKLTAHQVFQCDSRYWVFHTPIFSEWIPNDENRSRIEQAAKGSGELPEDCLDELRRTVRGRRKRKRRKRKKRQRKDAYDIGLSHSSYLLERKASEKLIIKRNTQERKNMKKREAPVVSFVSSMDDEFDIGELF